MGVSTACLSVRTESKKRITAINNLLKNSLHVSSYLPAGSMIFTGAEAHKPYLLKCPEVNGDLVVLHRLPADAKKKDMKVAYEYDRWRDSTLRTEQSKRLRLAGPPFDAKAGIFSFLLTPDLKDGGLYACEVSLNDNIFSQWTTLSVLKGTV